MRYLLAALFIVFAWLPNAWAQGYVDILPDEVKNPFYERRERISSELSIARVNEWVGEYSIHVGETWSQGLIWGPSNGFAAFRDTCSMGPRAWVNYGGVEFRDGMLVLLPERAKEAENLLEFPSTQYTLVKWGPEHWLVPTDKLALFAYAINSRSGDEYEVAYSKIDDSAKRSVDRPNLPSEYRRLLGLPTINARVIQIGEQGKLWFPRMVIDVGKNRGVIQGMSFWLRGQKNISVKVRVSEVGGRTSVVEAVLIGTSGENPANEIVPGLGWRFTSRVPSTYF
jgi:hypothetical protein